VPASEASGDNPADTGPFTIYTLRPVDESAKDAALVQFLASLKKAVAAKDAAALTALLDPEVSAGDGTQGLDAFRRRWGLDKGAAASPLWALINTALSMGGAFAPGASDTFVLPYAAALFPSRLDPSRYRVVTAANVNVRAQPSLDAPAVGTAAYLVVRRLDPAAGETLPAVTLNGQAYRWVKVQLPSGTVGYMVEKYLWNPAVRVVLRKSSGGWRVAGVEGG
ncbi:MAG: SH3 domain-containing protein, partial [Firmicutes bacterium]|nr:SH3 domain-containing protein [Bacillota bacterium]